MLIQVHAFFLISNTFISNSRLELTKNQANAKEDPEAELFYLKIINSSSTLPSKNNRTYSKNKQDVENRALLQDY